MNEFFYFVFESMVNAFDELSSFFLILFWFVGVYMLSCLFTSSKE